MRKALSLLLSLLVLSVLFFALAPLSSAQTDKGFAQITDFTGTLTEDEINGFEEQLLSLKEEYSYDAVIAVINNDTLDEYDITSLETFADDLYDNGGYGVGPTNDGILVLVRIGSPYSNHFHLCTTGHLIAVCTEQDIDDMYYEVRPYLTEEDVPGAVRAIIDAERAFFDKAKERTDENGEPTEEFNYYGYEGKPEFNPVMKALISILGGLGIGGVSTMSMKSKLKSVSSKSQASDYVVPGSFELRNSRDMFLYANVTRTARPQDDSRGHSGGGAGFHISSSGVSHGGGTR